MNVSDPDMQFHYYTSLGILLLVVFFPVIALDNTAGTTNNVSRAQNQLVQAFILVQQADIAGAPPVQISLLTHNLNAALLNEQNSTIESLALANATALQATNLATNARAQAFYNQLGSYSIAITAGFGSALFVTEFQNVRGFARRAIHRRTG